MRQRMPVSVETCVKLITSSLPVKGFLGKKKLPAALRRSKATTFSGKEGCRKSSPTKKPCRTSFQGRGMLYLEKVASESLETTGHSSDLICSDNSGNVTNLDAQASTVTPATESDLRVTEEQTALCGVDIDSDDNFSNTGVCAMCNREPSKGEELKRCSCCHIMRYCSVECQRKDWMCHRFACSVVAKRSATKKP